MPDRLPNWRYADGESAPVNSMAGHSDTYSHRSDDRLLDRQSFVPLYYQLAELLKERLEAGVWAPGDRFPSERELAEEFGVSRMVVRPALNLLVGDGDIERIKGSGTFVRPAKKDLPVRTLSSLFLDPLPDDWSVRVIETGERELRPGAPETPQVAELGPRVARVVVLLSRAGTPLCLCDSHTSLARAPWVLATARALAEGRPATPPRPRPELARGEGYIQTSFAGRWEAAELTIAPGSPVLMTTVTQGAPDGPVEFLRCIVRTDAARIRVSTT